MKKIIKFMLAFVLVFSLVSVSKVKAVPTTDLTLKQEAIMTFSPGRNEAQFYYNEAAGSNLYVRVKITGLKKGDYVVANYFTNGTDFDEDEQAPSYYFYASDSNPLYDGNTLIFGGRVTKRYAYDEEGYPYETNVRELVIKVISKNNETQTYSPKIIIERHTSHKFTELYYSPESEDVKYPYLSSDCDICGKCASGKVNMVFDKASFVYNGSAQKPKVTLRYDDSDGTRVTLVENRDYKMSYSSGRTNCGTYTATANIILNTSYLDITSTQRTIKRTFVIKPKSTYITSLAPYSKGFKVYWKQITKQVSGYQIKYSTTSGFTSDVHSRTITNWKQTASSFNSLKAKKNIM